MSCSGILISEVTKKVPTWDGPHPKPKLDWPESPLNHEPGKFRCRGLASVTKSDGKENNLKSGRGSEGFIIKKLQRSLSISVELNIVFNTHLDRFLLRDNLLPETK